MTFKLLQVPYYGTDFINVWEYAIAPIYLFIIYLVAYSIRKKYYKKSPLRKYLIPGLTVKLVGAIGVTLIYSYYYKGGDTCNYFYNGKIISSVLLSNPHDGIRLLLSQGGNFSSDLLKYVGGMDYSLAESSYMIVKITAIVQLFTFQSFLTTAILFGFISFWGIWKILKVFYGYYPDLLKKFAIGFLFIPSVFFWGSGILKDTVCLTALALFFTYIDSFFLKGNRKTSIILGILISGYIITMIKVYIIMSFSLCIIILIFIHYRGKIKSKNTRLFITPIFVCGSLILGFFLIKIISENSSSEKYTFDHLLETSEITRTYIYSISGGSGYSLGEIENSIWGLIKVLPAGINVTLFRPYFWEAHNLIALIASIESFFLLIITLYILIKTRFFYFFKIALSNNLIFFCLSFSLLFAFSIGITSYNFGSLVRYKIPCIPFYLAGIYMILYTVTKSKIKDDSFTFKKTSSL